MRRTLRILPALELNFADMRQFLERIVLREVERSHVRHSPLGEGIVGGGGRASGPDLLPPTWSGPGTLKTRTPGTGPRGIRYRFARGPGELNEPPTPPTFITAASSRLGPRSPLRPRCTFGGLNGGQGPD